MATPLMPKATAVWLVENTTLTFEQVADFCGMHPLEIQGIADGEVATGIMGQNPIEAGELEAGEIEKAEKDEGYRMVMASHALAHMKMAGSKKKGARYTPVARRQDKPEAIAYILKNHPYIPDSQIIKLIGTTKKTIESIKERTHWNIANIKPKDPVLLGLCMQTQLDAVANKFRPAGMPQTTADDSDSSAA
ncbi:MAG: cell cycle transcriptional regulator TrcR [Alphaproteobacteria bacterium]|nr:cell cycle transcriptional regulator TrcR [Alphaproteobacteria bacterium]